MLSEATADRFVAMTGGRLVKFRCPDGSDGSAWHLFNPTAERGRTTRH